MSKTVAEQMVEMIAAAGIQRVYGVTGDSLNLFNDAIRRDGRIKWVHVRHEEAGAYAAMAEGVLGGLGCCAGSSGPGHVHLINGLYDAHRWGAPVLALPSTILRDDYGMESFQETDLRMFDGCSHYNQLAQTAKQLPRMLQQAIQHALSLHGVGVCGFSGDLIAEDVAEGAIVSPVYRPEPLLRPSDAELDKLAELLNSADKIMIYGGIGCTGAHELVMSLADKLKAPVGYTLKGKMALEYDNRFDVGMTGFIGGAACADAIHDCDVLLMLGTDFPWKEFLMTKAKVVQILNRPERLGRRTHVEMGLAGDIAPTLEALLPRIKAKRDDSFLKDRLAARAKDRERLQGHAAEKGKTGAIGPEFLAATLDKYADDDAIFTSDTGMSTVWAARYLRATGKRTLMGSFSHGSMANAMPQAIGAAFAGGGRQVVACCGDGGISMLLGDIMTIAQYKLPVKLVVFNNGSLGMVEIEMQLAGIPDNQTDLPNPKFEQVAEACGIRGIRVDDPGKLDAAIKDALSHDGPALVNVTTDHYAVGMPPHTTLKQLRAYTISQAKMLLEGRSAEVLQHVKENLKYLGDL
ncbi:MAG: ubiquinone-dependent pyruvate dehydrogenase [Gammaproteobacteria bacterium]|nr:ubiquinone-dependent pyruvate dehydrogenase [Gammaproteobacteria bacterium]